MSQVQEKPVTEKDTPVCGGWSQMQSTTGVEPAELKKLQAILEQVREAAQVKAGRTFTALEPLEYATQVVAGMNYRIKAHTGDGIHGVFVVYQPISSETVNLTSYTQEGTTQTVAK